MKPFSIKRLSSNFWLQHIQFSIIDRTVTFYRIQLVRNKTKTTWYFFNGYFPVKFQVKKKLNKIFYCFSYPSCFFFFIISIYAFHIFFQNISYKLKKKKIVTRINEVMHQHSYIYGRLNNFFFIIYYPLSLFHNFGIMKLDKVNQYTFLFLHFQLTEITIIDFYGFFSRLIICFLLWEIFMLKNIKFVK